MDKIKKQSVAFLHEFFDKRTQRQTDRQTNAGQNITSLAAVISQLPNLFIGTPRIPVYNFILLLIVRVCSFSMLHSAKLAEDWVLVFINLSENQKS